MIDRDFFAWCWYYVRTEEYDRTLPGHWSRWESTTYIPVGKARGVSTKFAKCCTAVIGSSSKNLQAKKHALILTFDKQKEILDIYPKLTEQLDKDLTLLKKHTINFIRKGVYDFS